MKRKFCVIGRTAAYSRSWFSTEEQAVDQAKNLLAKNKANSRSPEPLFVVQVVKVVKPVIDIPVDVISPEDFESVGKEEGDEEYDDDGLWEKPVKRA